MNFIKTSDKETADALSNLGFVMLSNENGLYTFINCQAISFSNDFDKKKIIYSNKLSI